MKLTSYWLDTSKPFSGSAKGPVEGTYDVAVIGGGLTGSSAALALARKGARVILLEAETIGHAASGRNGGMCNNGFAQDYGTMSAKLGTRDGRPALPGLRRRGGHGRAPRRRRRGSTAISRRVGKIKLAAKPEHYDKLARSPGTARRQCRSRHEMVRRAELAAEIGSERYYGGLIYRKSAGMHVGRFVRGLAEAAARRGVAHPRAHADDGPASRRRRRPRQSRRPRAGFGPARFCWRAAYRIRVRSAGFAVASCRSAPS